MRDIIGTEIVFSTKSSVICSQNKEYNKICIHSIENYINDMLRECKYITWESICKCLGIETTPDEIESFNVLRYNGNLIHFDIIKENSKYIKFVLRWKE